MIQRIEILIIVIVALLSIFSQRFFSETTQPTDASSKPAKSGWLHPHDADDESISVGDELFDEHDTDKTAAPKSNAMAVSPKEEQIAIIQQDLEELRDGRLRDSLSRAHRSKQLLDEAKKNAGWIFKSEDERQRIERLDAEHTRDMRALAQVKADELALEARIKPLYGIVSAQFYVEQRNTISSCVAKVQEVAYNNAWYSGLFNAHRAEGLTDLLIQFLLEWLMGYVIMYPFAVLYYALWAAPWSIYAYSSSMVDLVPAVVVWIVGVGAMLLPLAALFGGAWLIFVKYGESIAEALRRRAEERQQQQRRPRPHALGHY